MPADLRSILGFTHLVSANSVAKSGNLPIGSDILSIWFHILPIQFDNLPNLCRNLPIKPRNLPFVQLMESASGLESLLHGKLLFSCLIRSRFLDPDAATFQFVLPTIDYIAASFILNQLLLNEIKDKTGNRRLGDNRQDEGE